MDQLHLLNLSDQDLKNFEAIVSADIKGGLNDHDSDYLYQNLDLWHYCLTTMKRTAEYNLSSRNVTKKNNLLKMRSSQSTEEEIDNYLSSELQWRVNTIKFLSVIERRLLYVKMLIKQA